MPKPPPILPLEILDTLECGEPLVSPELPDDLQNHASLLAMLDMLDSLRRGRQPSRATVDWFENTVEKWSTGEADDLEAASGLRGNDRKKVRHHQQTNHLRAAFDLVDCEKLGRKARAESVADEIKRFEIRFGGRRLPDAPHSNWSGVRRHIWRASRFGPLPHSWERIADRCWR